MSAPCINPRFSIVMPAYNVSATVRRAIESVFSQSFSDWEIVVCDDCSSDETCEIVKSFCSNDSRVRLLRSEENSGHALTPRLNAIRNARAEYIIPLDADDYLSPDFLMQIARRIEETGADMVMCRLNLLDTDGTFLRSIPEEPVSPDDILQGTEAILLTLYTWRVSGLGAIRKSLYFEGLEEIAPEIRATAYSDDILTRVMCMDSDKVAFSDASYNYVALTGSVTKSFSPAYFDRSVRDAEIMRLVEKRFSYPDKAWILAQRKNICQLIECMEALVSRGKCFPSETRRMIDRRLRNIYNGITKKDMERSVSGKLNFLLRFGYTPAKLMLGLNGLAKKRK